MAASVRMIKKKSRAFIAAIFALAYFFIFFVLIQTKSFDYFLFKNKENILYNVFIPLIECLFDCCSHLFFSNVYRLLLHRIWEVPK